MRVQMFQDHYLHVIFRRKERPMTMESWHTRIGYIGELQYDFICTRRK